MATTTNTTNTTTTTTTVFVVITQIYENYGFHDWNGKGKCPSRWKAKGEGNWKVAAPDADAALAACAAHFAANPDSDAWSESPICAEPWGEWCAEIRARYPASYDGYGEYLIRRAEENAIGFPPAA